MPGEKDYWSTKPSLSVPIFSQVMSRNRFQEIKRYFHLADNENLTESKTAKVDPTDDELLKNYQQCGIFDKLLSIDESMLPYRGHFSIKQYIRNKPICFAYKFWFEVMNVKIIYFTLMMTEWSSLFSGKIIPLLQLVLILAKSRQSIKSQDG